MFCVAVHFYGVQSVLHRRRADNLAHIYLFVSGTVHGVTQKCCFSPCAFEAYINPKTVLVLEFGIVQTLPILCFFIS